MRSEDGNGGLPTDIPESVFLCDINHGIKAMAKTFFPLAALSNRLSIYTNMDSLRVKCNIGWYVRGYRSNKYKVFKDFVTNARAPIAHHLMIINAAIEYGAGREILMISITDM